MVDSIRPLEEARATVSDREAPPPAAPDREPPRPAAPPAAPEQKLWVKLPGRDDPRLRRIELLLTMFPGTQQLVIWCEREKKRIGARCLIHEGLILELQELLGKDNVVVK